MEPLKISSPPWSPFNNCFAEVPPATKYQKPKARQRAAICVFISSSIAWHNRFPGFCDTQF